MVLLKSALSNPSALVRGGKALHSSSPRPLGLQGQRVVVASRAPPDHQRPLTSSSLGRERDVALNGGELLRLPDATLLRCDGASPDWCEQEEGLRWPPGGGCWHQGDGGATVSEAEYSCLASISELDLPPPSSSPFDLCLDLEALDSKLDEGSLDFAATVFPPSPSHFEFSCPPDIVDCLGAADRWLAGESPTDNVLTMTTPFPKTPEVFI